MKRLVVVLLLLALVSMGLLAVDNSLRDYLTTPSFTSFMSILKDGRKSRTEIDEAYGEFLEENPSGYGRARGVYLYGIYLLDTKDKSLIKNIQAELKRIEATLSEGIEKDTLNLDMVCMVAAADKNLSNGMKVLDVLKDYTAKWGSEVVTLLTDAWRHINTPEIVGGSSKKALEGFLPLLSYADEMVPEHQYSLYKGLATAYANLKQWNEANTYYLKAAEIYPYEIELVELGEKIRKKLK